MNLNKIIDSYISEDIGDGDHTTLACIDGNARGEAKLLVKESGILAGVDIASLIFKRFDKNIDIKILINDGSSVKSGDVAFVVKGRACDLLNAERLVLNVMQRMSGIATNTNRYVQKVKNTKAKILDTRKTTPGFRYFEKLAVTIGGGFNHRMGLYDMVMIKDNHIDFAGGIRKAIESVNEYLALKGKDLKIEIEARSMDEIAEILLVGRIHRILIDNFDPKETRKAVRMIAGMYETESSGNITLNNVAEYASCGVDYISIGALTHQIKSLDLSLKAVLK